MADGAWNVGFADKAGVTEMDVATINVKKAGAANTEVKATKELASALNESGLLRAGMGVQIDQAWQDQAAGHVENAPGTVGRGRSGRARSGRGRTGRDDPITLDCNVADTIHADRLVPQPPAADEQVDAHRSTRRIDSVQLLLK